MKRKLKFENFKKCLETTQLENKKKLEKNKIDINGMKECIKNNNIKNTGKV